MYFIGRKVPIWRKKGWEYARKGKTRGESEHLSIHEYREQQFDKLARILRESLDMDRIYEILELRRLG